MNKSGIYARRINYNKITKKFKIIITIASFAHIINYSYNDVIGASHVEEVLIHHGLFVSDVLYHTRITELC